MHAATSRLHLVRTDRSVPGVYHVRSDVLDVQLLVTQRNQMTLSAYELGKVSVD